MNDIKFTYAPDGKMELLPERFNTDMHFLLQIGAMHYTAKHTGPYEMEREYPTDQEGLKLIEKRCHDAIASIHLMISAMGQLLAQIDSSIGGHAINQGGWLVVWLTEAAEVITKEREHIQSAMARKESRP